jgi:RNA ligase
MQSKPGNETYLFEIIYPENRIVVDYGGYKGLDLLAVLDTETGKTLPMVELDDVGTPVHPIDFTSFAELKSIDEKNKEGFALHFPESDLRLKVKLEDYVRLHKIMTGLSEIGVWEMLRDGKDPYAQDIPDEMYDWLKDVVERLQAKFRLIESNARKAFDWAIDQHTRKEQAAIIKRWTPYTGVAFSMLDGKDYSQEIWRMIRPHGSSTFRSDIDS